MSETTRSASELSVWQTEGLRLTAFTSPAAQFSQQNWWSEIVGEEPEKRDSKPRTGEQLESGKYGNGRLILRVNPTRIDWQFAAIENESPEDVKIPVIGSFPESRDVFSELMQRWLELDAMPPIVRLAFGTNLLHPVDNPESGHEFLLRYLPFNFNLEGTSDFLYQISRRKDSTIIPNLKINRLTKWFLAVIQNVMVSFVPGQITTVPIDFQTFVASLELDINTVPDVGIELNRNILPQLFNELINFGNQIAQEGDRP